LNTSLKPGTTLYVGTAIDTIWSQIYYHVWWPGQGNDPMYLMNQSMNRTRNNYYENNYTPHMYTNGKDSGSGTATWISDPKTYLEEVGLYEINLIGTRSGNEISFDVKMNVIETTPTSQDLRLFVATVIDTVHYPASPNGLTEHHNPVIALLTGNTGKQMKFISGITYTESFTWSMPSGWINHADILWKSSGLKAVSWIQNYKSKEILQVNEFRFN
jgi:hypothetical protein